MKGRPGLAKRIREAAGPEIRPVDLAKLCRVSRVAAGKWLQDGDIKAVHLFCIADYYGVEGRWLALGLGPKIAKKPAQMTAEALEIGRLYDQLRPEVREHIRDLIHTLTLPGAA